MVIYHYDPGHVAHFIPETVPADVPAPLQDGHYCMAFLWTHLSVAKDEEGHWCINAPATVLLEGLDPQEHGCLSEARNGHWC